MGTPEIASTYLKYLIDHHFNIIGAEKYISHFLISEGLLSERSLTADNHRDIKLAILCKVFRQKFDLMEKSIDYNFYTINKDNLQLKASDIYCQTWVLYFICLTVIRRLVVENGDETKINHIDKFIFGNELLKNNW